MCDVDANHLDKAAKAVPGARLYSDWRELLEKEGDKIDSVNVAVPDHMHFAIAYNAIQKGKHVYCQKPLCHDVAEVRALTEASIKKRVVTQLGTQLAAGLGDRTAVQLLQDGAHRQDSSMSTFAPTVPAPWRITVWLGRVRPSRPEPPTQLKWDLWLGTAPVRPFAPDIYHPVKWRAWQDFGTGWSGDIGCHIFDAVWKGLGLKPALDGHRRSAVVLAEFPDPAGATPGRRGSTSPGPFRAMTLTEGKDAPGRMVRRRVTIRPKTSARSTRSRITRPSRSMLIGTEGAMLLELGRGPILLPEKKFENLPARNSSRAIITITSWTPASASRKRNRSSPRPGR